MPKRTDKPKPGTLNFRRWWEKNKEIHRERCKRYRQQNAAKQKVRHAEYYSQNKDSECRRTRARLAALRQEAIKAYGGKCSCVGCGIAEPVFLAIDHVNNDRQQRKHIHGHGSKFLLWLKKNNYPKDFQLLCHNCNFAKTKGECPHIRKADNVEIELESKSVLSTTS
jgi:hypothetical protein